VLGQTWSVQCNAVYSAVQRMHQVYFARKSDVPAAGWSTLDPPLPLPRHHHMGAPGQGSAVQCSEQCAV
jgi:hypothetical protein